jgi:D-glycero-D-manno-heptose 1,7-bisphosphate phosphatase
MGAAVFLDRDGVLNAPHVVENKAYAPLSPDRFEIAPSAAQDVARLRQAGYAVIVVTNQPEVAKGSLRLEDLQAMHARLRVQVSVDDIFVCAHVDADGCACRKPKPGLLREAAAKWGLDLRRSFVIGDTWRDVAAGQAAGCYTVLLARPYSGPANPDHRADTLSQAVAHILTLSNGAPP